MQGLLPSYSWNLERPSLSFSWQEYRFGEAQAIESKEVRKEAEEPIFKKPAWLKDLKE